MSRKLSAALLAFFIASVAVSAALSPATAGNVKGRTKIGEEVLVAKDYGKGGRVYVSRLCGSSGVLIRGDLGNYDIGIEFLDIKTGKRIEVSPGPKDMDFGCSPDGRWALYADNSALPYDPAYDYMEDGIEAGTGDVVTLYRRELSTGKKERVALIRSEGYFNAVSPDGEQIFLGVKHDLSDKVHTAQWRGVWLSGKWDTDGTVWFPDSSGVVSVDSNPGRICVDLIGASGLEKCFPLDAVTKYDFMPVIAVDRENRIYFLAPPDPGDEEAGGRIAYSCKIKTKELYCKKIDELDGIIAPPLGFLSDGDILFADEEENCISRFSSERKAPECVVNDAHLLGVTPDGRWLVYERGRMIRTPSRELSHWESDLYVRGLTND